jgi:uncharacterized protein YjbI with pentapeptide repeats
MAVSFKGANLEGVDFKNADVRGANFRDASLIQARNLAKAKGLKKALNLDEATL